MKTLLQYFQTVPSVALVVNFVVTLSRHCDADVGLLFTSIQISKTSVTFLVLGSSHPQSQIILDGSESETALKFCPETRRIVNRRVLGGLRLVS